MRTFLRRFGADIDKPVRITDVAGDEIVISDELFRMANGGWKVTKRKRAPVLLLLAETILDPDEIWLSVAEKKDEQGRLGAHVDRRYLRFDPKTGLVVIFDWNWRSWQWEGATTFPPQRKGKSMRTDVRQMERRREGILLYRRNK